MSYSKAWKLIQTMEKRLGFSILDKKVGGLSGGGSQVTPKGKDLMKRYEQSLFFKRSQDDYDFEISLSNLAYRSLRIKEGQPVSVAFKWESIWLIPEET